MPVVLADQMPGVAGGFIFVTPDWVHVDLIPLMLAENGVLKTDGAKRLNRYLTAEQFVALQSIPPVGSERSQLIAAQRAVAREYIIRGRRLASRLDIDWPADLEAAVRSLWRRELDIDLG